MIASLMLCMHRRVHSRAFSRTICALQEVFAVMPDKFVMLFRYTYNVFFLDKFSRAQKRSERMMPRTRQQLSLDVVLASLPSAERPSIVFFASAPG